MIINNKFNIGDTVYVALMPNDVTFDDRLPVVCARVYEVRFSGCMDEDGVKANIHYELELVDGWNNLSESESRIFSSEEEAEQEAKNLAEKRFEKIESEYSKISKMLSKN